MGDGLGRSGGSSFVCFISMITACAKMDKEKDFSSYPVLGWPSPRDVGVTEREVPRLLVRSWANGVPCCFLPLSARDCGFQAGRIKGWKRSIVFLQLQKMNQHSPGTCLTRKGKSQG